MDDRMPRYDYFIVWGHGLKFLNGILNLIRSHPALKIVKIQYFNPETIEQLVETVYSYDYAPIAHLAGKTEYLRRTPNQVLFIFVENRMPEEDYFGDGAYRHMESNTIKALKETIRNHYNERINGKRSEDHVIHASDNQLQTDHILRYLGFEGVTLFSNRHLAIKAPYHLREVTAFCIMKLPLASLRCRIVVGDPNLNAPKLTKIEDTPHYRALCGETQSYEAYVAGFIGQALTDDHTLSNLLQLRDCFNYLVPPFETSYIIVLPTTQDGYIVLDGVHRAAILKYQGATDIQVAVMNRS